MPGGIHHHYRYHYHYHQQNHHYQQNQQQQQKYHHHYSQQVLHWGAHKNYCEDSNMEDSFEKLSLKAENAFDQSNYQKAEKLYTKLLGRARVELGENNPRTVKIMSNLAGRNSNLLL